MRAWFLLSVVCSLCSLEAQSIYGEGSAQPAKGVRFLQMRFARYDTSGDMRLNMREFASSRGNAKFKEISRANLSAFLMADLTGDLLLNEFEYLFLHRRVKVLLSGERALIFGKADKNRDGQLDAKEWEVFAKRAFEQDPISYYDDDQNGHVSWTEWLGYRFTAGKFAGARMKDLKRVLPESLMALVVREASVHADLIIGASDNPWTRDVLQQLALFAPGQATTGSFAYFQNGGLTLNTVGSPILSAGSLTNFYVGSTVVNLGTISVAPTSSSGINVNEFHEVYAHITPSESLAWLMETTQRNDISSEQRTRSPQIGAPTISPAEVSVTVTIIRAEDSPIMQLPIGISDVFPLTPPDPRGLSDSTK